MAFLNFDVHFSDLSEAARNPLAAWDVVGRLCDWLRIEIRQPIGWDIDDNLGFLF